MVCKNKTEIIYCVSNSKSNTFLDDDVKGALKFGNVPSLRGTRTIFF